MRITTACTGSAMLHYGYRNTSGGTCRYRARAMVFSVAMRFEVDGWIVSTAVSTAARAPRECANEGYR